MAVGDANDAVLLELDRHLRAIVEAAFEMKRTASGVQAIERNLDRLLASAQMLALNISDVLGRPRTLASWTEDDSRL